MTAHPRETEREQPRDSGCSGCSGCSDCRDRDWLRKQAVKVAEAYKCPVHLVELSFSAVEAQDAPYEWGWGVRVLAIRKRWGGGYRVVRPQSYSWAPQLEQAVAAAIERAPFYLNESA